MKNGSNKLLVIGIDQAIPYLLNKFLEKNSLPNISTLHDNGIMAEAYPCPPCDTPTNWTTIATGAKTATHGVTSFYLHIIGDSFDEGLNLRSRAQLSKYCRADYLWNVADNNSLIPFVFNYPSGWPIEFKRGAMSLFTWEIPESNPRMIAPSKTYRFEIENNTKSIRLNISIKSKEMKEEVKKEFYLICLDENRYEALKILISERVGWQIIRINEWSEWIEILIPTKTGQLPCLFKISLQKIDPKEKWVKIKRTAIYNTKGWTSPEIFGEKLIKNVFEYDLPEKHDVEFMIYDGLKKFLISAREESLTLARAIKYAKTELNWDVCFFHFHPLDTINHNSLAYLYKESPLYEEKIAKDTIKYVETAYKIVDELVGNLLKSCVDKNMYICFVSDHGAIPIWKIVNLPRYFMKYGLLEYKWNLKKKYYTIDWEKTKAFPYIEPPFIWINLKGRDPKGIVKNSEYEELKDEIIEILYDMKDPYTNDKLIELAIKREDADYLGLNSDRIGDIVYFLKPPYGLFDGNLSMLNASRLPESLLNKPEIYSSQSFFGAHAYFLPNTKFGEYTISAPVILAGPAIKKGEDFKTPINLIDLVPTFSQLLQIPKPKHSQGRVLNEMMV